MTASEQLTIRTVIFHPEAINASALPEYRLLHELGHDVQAAVSPDQAVEMLQNDQADLLIVDADRATQRDFMHHLGDLPADHQPQQVAIFSEAIDESLPAIISRLGQSKVQVLLKPLHMHGLLRMLRDLEARA